MDKVRSLVEVYSTQGHWTGVLLHDIKLRPVVIDTGEGFWTQIPGEILSITIVGRSV